MIKAKKKSSIYVTIDENIYIDFKVHCAKNKIKIVTILRPFIEKKMRDILKTMKKG